MPGVPLRRRLFVLTAAGILPLAIAAGIGLLALAQHQRTQAERVGLELARSVATALDAELRSSILVLDAIATTPTLDTDDLFAFRDRARRVLDLEKDWAAIALADRSGKTARGHPLRRIRRAARDRRAREPPARRARAAAGRGRSRAQRARGLAVRDPGAGRPPGRAALRADGTRRAREDPRHPHPPARARQLGDLGH